MRVIVPVLLLAVLAGCSKNDSAANNTAAAAPAPRPTGPPPLTPKLDIEAAPGNSDHWMTPASNASDPVSAPYGNLLDRPVVDAPRKPR